MRQRFSLSINIFIAIPGYHLFTDDPKCLPQEMIINGKQGFSSHADMEHLTDSIPELHPG